jgi:hypothetical protein
MRRSKHAKTGGYRYVILIRMFLTWIVSVRLIQTRIPTMAAINTNNTHIDANDEVDSGSARVEIKVESCINVEMMWWGRSENNSICG